MAIPNIVNVATIDGKTDSGELNTTYTTSLVTNVGSSGKSYKIYDGSTDRFIAYNVNCPANTVVFVTDKNSSFYLEEGDQVRGGAATNSRLDWVVSYEIIS